MSNIIVESDMRTRSGDTEGDYVKDVFMKSPLIGDFLCSQDELDEIKARAQAELDLRIMKKGSAKKAGDRVLTFAVIHYAKSWEPNECGRLSEYIAGKFGYYTNIDKVWNEIESCIMRTMVREKRFLAHKGKTYDIVETILVHSLGAKHAWDSLFDLVNDLYNRQKKDPAVCMSIRMVFQELKNKFDQKGDHALNLTDIYWLDSSVRQLIQKRPVFTAYLVQKIVEWINSKSGGKKIHLWGYLENMLSDWYERKHQDRYMDEAYDIEDIESWYNYRDKEIVLRATAVEVDESQRPQAEAIIYIGNMEYSRIPLSVMCQGWSYETDMVDVPLQIDLKYIPQISLSLEINGNIVYDSGDLLKKRIIAFKYGKEEPLQLLRKGQYIFYIADKSEVEFLNCEIKELQKFIYQIHLRKQFCIRVKGRIVGRDQEMVETDGPCQKNTPMDESFLCRPQNKIIEEESYIRMLVNAAPGTGKTYMLIERIIYLVSNEESPVEPDEIVVLCFSRAAVEVVRERLNQAYVEGRVDDRIGLVDVRTIDSFASQLLYWIKNSEDKRLDNYRIGDLDYDDRIKLFSQIISENRDWISQCSHLFVDEVQDLVGARAEMILSMIHRLPSECGITLLGDSCQAIYDYQVEQGDITSDDFYKAIMNRKGEFCFFSVEKNYRQLPELSETGGQYRRAILSGSSGECDKAWNEIAGDLISEFPVGKIEELTEWDISEYCGEGTVGILTRKNSQALKIASKLRENGINYTFKRRLSEEQLGGWIAEFFNEYPNESISEEDFVSMFEEDFTGDAQDIWQDILDCLPEERGKTGVRDILRGIRIAGRKSSFYNWEDKKKITISNIHRSKGCEFDTVLVEDSIFDESEKELQEHKVSYVAITRPKEQIYKIQLGRDYSKVDKAGDRRCYESAFTRYREQKKHLTLFEVGLAHDLNLRSFAEISGVQEYIRQQGEELCGSSVYLKKGMYEGSNSYVRYFLIEPSSGMCLGETSKEFAESLERVLKKILMLSDSSSVIYEAYPRLFQNIVIDQVISVIEEANGQEQGAKKYGEMVTWNAVTIIGYGEALY